MYQRILVPIDGSATAEQGLREAIGTSVRTSPVPVLLVRRHPETIDASA